MSDVSLSPLTSPSPRRAGLLVSVLCTLAAGSVLAQAAEPTTKPKPMAGSQARPQVQPPGPDYPVFGGKPLPVERTSAKVVGVYVPMWESPAHVDRIQAGSVTHLLYSFLRLCGPGQLAKDTARCEGKQHFQLTTGGAEKRFDAAFTRLKASEPQVKVLASVGGWGGSDGFYYMANEAAKRAVFVESALQFLREHPSFDGIDIDWEHPGGNGSANGVALGSAADGQGYADLMSDLRRGLQRLEAELGRPYLLTTAVNSTEAVVKRVNFKQAAQDLDLVFMMSYDFYGNWSTTAGNHTTLISSRTPEGQEADDSVDRSVRNLEAAGVPRAKLVAGVAMYGRGFAGVTQAQTGAAKTGGYPGADGSAGYREIAARYLGPKGQGVNGYLAQFDAQTQAWNLFHPQHKLWMGYDDPRAVILKGRYAVKNGLAGVFAWELTQDNGDVLNAMNHGVGNLLLKR